MGFPRPHSGKESACQFRGARDIQSLGQEDPLEEEMATHSGILAWKIKWTESGGLQYMGSQRVGHDRSTEHIHTYPQPSQELGP